ncbi:MAG: hypothetical protein JOZ41_15535 [Chloroflexi bacterium]|nr:hypothetical protein [Chloroflexota bacterium]
MGLVIAIVIIVVILLIALGAVTYLRRQRSAQLQGRFGPEYGRTLEGAGSRREAEAALRERQKRVDNLAIRPLSPEDRQRFSTEWEAVQAQFVDDPPGAVNQADRLVTEVMQARGYPMGDFEQRAEDISVNHAGVVQNYRAAHDLALRQQEGEATTEDLRQAMIHYRSLFAELLETLQARSSTA